MGQHRGAGDGAACEELRTCRKDAGVESGALKQAGAQPRSLERALRPLPGYSLASAFLGGAALSARTQPEQNVRKLPPQPANGFAAT